METLDRNIDIAGLTPGTDVMIFKYFRRKIQQKIGIFDSKQS
jgi:hypothetical protein